MSRWSVPGNVIPCAVLIAVAVAVYWVTVDFQLLNTLDDKYYIILNDTIKSLSVENIRQIFSTYYVGNYAPIHILSYLLDYAAWGLNPAGYHVENVFLHTVNGVLFYLLLRRLLLTEWQALAASWIFLFHPVQVETVAWVSQRKNVLAMLFFLLSILAYQQYLSSCRNSSKVSCYLVSLGCASAAMLTKSIAIILPVVVLFYDLSFMVGRDRKTKFMASGPFIIVAVVAAMLALSSQSLEHGGGRRSYPGGSGVSAFFTMTPVLLEYLKDCVWPMRLIPYYQVPIRVSPDGVFVAALGALLVISCAGIYCSYRSKNVRFWVTLFLVGLIPVLQFVPIITLKNDRYLYFPLLGFSVLAVGAVTQLHRVCSPLFKKIVLCGFVGILAMLPLLARTQTNFWRNDVTLWTRAIEVDAENRFAWLQLAKSYTDEKNAHSAMYCYNRYRQLRRWYGPVRGYEDQ